MSDRHLAALKEKHHNIDIILAEEENRPNPDENKVHALKKDKLNIKDQMENIAQNA